MKCIIIDDEPIARKGMKRLIDNNPELELEASFDSAECAEAWLLDNKTDLIFLDIEMPGLSGIEFARRLSKDYMVIFTTAYSEYALDSYEVEAIDYLIKPIKKERFDKAVSRAITYNNLIHASESNPADSDVEYIIIKSNRKYVRIKLEEILFVEGLKDYIIIHLYDRKVITRMMLKTMVELLPKNKFMRISKSYIVNKAKVDSFDNNDITIGKTELSIGISYRDTVIKSLFELD